MKLKYLTALLLLLAVSGQPARPQGAAQLLSKTQVMELVKAGHPILMTWDRDETESGVVHRFGRYSMARGVAT